MGLLGIVTGIAIGARCTISTKVVAVTPIFWRSLSKGLAKIGTTASEFTIKLHDVALAPLQGLSVLRQGARSLTVRDVAYP